MCVCKVYATPDVTPVPGQQSPISTQYSLELLAPDLYPPLLPPNEQPQPQAHLLGHHHHPSNCPQPKKRRETQNKGQPHRRCRKEEAQHRVPIGLASKQGNPHHIADPEEIHRAVCMYLGGSFGGGFPCRGLPWKGMSSMEACMR